MVFLKSAYGDTTIMARLIKSEEKYKKYINNICEFKDLRYTSDLFVKMQGLDLDFGDIDNIEIDYKEGKEYWIVTTSKSFFKFQILNKITNIRENEEITCNRVDEVTIKRMERNLRSEIDLMFQRINEDIDVSKYPWI